MTEEEARIDKIAQVVENASARFEQEQEQIALEWQRVVIAKTEADA